MHENPARLRGILTLVLGLLLLAACNEAKTIVVTQPPVLPTMVDAPAAANIRATVPGTRPAPTATAAAIGVRADVPMKAYTTLRYVQTHNGDAPPGYQGNTVFENRERVLPPGSYREYDVDPRMSGVGRNAERLVINQDTGQAYYTRDHYATFVLIASGR